MGIFISMIKRLLREALLREANKREKYGCVMVYFDFNQDNWKEFLDKIDEDDLYLPKGEEDDFGKEKNPHATILFGLHTNVSDSEVMDKIKGLKKPKIEVKKISKFENEEFDVIKFDLESKDLNKANEIFKVFPYTNDFPDYHPHMTIAYVKKDKADKYIKILNKLKPLEIKVKSFVYSKADGTKKHHKI